MAPTGDNRIAILELSIGGDSWLELASFAEPAERWDRHTTGIARVDDSLIFVDGWGSNSAWIKIDLSTDEAISAGRCELGCAASSWDNELWAIQNRGDGLCRFPDFDALADWRPIYCTDSLGSAEALAMTGTTAVGLSLVEARGFDSVDVVTGEDLGRVGLEDWRSWVWGASVAGGLLHLIDDIRNDRDAGSGVRVSAFDLTSGQLVHEMFIDDSSYNFQPTGLWCDVEQ